MYVASGFSRTVSVSGLHRTVAIFATLATFACGTPKPVVVAPAEPAVDAAAASLQDDLDNIFSTSEFDRSFWSVLVRSSQSNDDIFALNASKLMMPGSVMKIVTAAAAAERLGWNHRFETRVVANSPIEAGVLRGDLIVVGGGDPGISERSDHPGALRELARQVRASGITKIEGGVIGDDDLFDDKLFGDGWTLDNLPYGYAAPVTALTYNENSVDLVIRAGAHAGDPVAIHVRPEGSGLQVDNQLVTVAESDRGFLTLQRNPGSPRVGVAGQIPANAEPFARTASVDNPTLFFARAFRDALAAEGIVVLGDAADIDELESKPNAAVAQVIAARQSLPLVDLVAPMMRVSQNQYAELLLRAVGGRNTVRDVLKGWGIGDDGYVIADGSGLSRYNYLSSDTIVRVLQHLHNDPAHALTFSRVLPASGGEGPLLKRLAGTPAEGRVKAKTGTVDNVRAIAGYVETAGGDTLVFSIIANNFVVPPAAVDRAADQALIRLASQKPRR